MKRRVGVFCRIPALFTLQKDSVALKCENYSCKVKTLREESHSRVKKMKLTLCSIFDDFVFMT